MEEWSVLTYKDYDFEDNGRAIKGRTVHCYRMNEQDGWPGVEYTKLSIPAGSPAYNVKPELGANYRFTFDRRGKVIGMEQI